MHSARTDKLNLSVCNLRVSHFAFIDVCCLRLGQGYLHLGGVPPFPNCLCSWLLVHLCDAFYGVFGYLSLCVYFAFAI